MSAIFNTETTEVRRTTEKRQISLCGPPCFSVASVRMRVLGCAAVLVLGFVVIGAASPRIKPVESDGGMVVSVSPHATKVGVEILRRGGSAVDAAIAVEFALAVVWPEAGNIGGGGFMMVHPGDGRRPVCIDYRETAPATASETMFTPEDGRHTHKIVGVPGTVSGMEVAHRRYGKLPWKGLVEPAVKLAVGGFVVDEHFVRSINAVLGYESVRTGRHQQEFRRVYGKPGGGEWKVGDRIVLKDLAATLQTIADRGAAGFYTGEVAEALVAEMKRGDGIISLEDLAGYRAKVREPVRGEFRGYDVYGAPPPSSGGTCLAQMLNVLEALDLRSRDRWSPQTLHLMAEAMKRAFCDRALYLGDQDFVSIPRTLVTQPYADWLATGIDRARATPSEELAPEIRLAPESPETTHFSVVDSSGMAVANTTTLEASWGARIVVTGAGFLLNNEMGDFNWFPGQTDRNGRIGTEPNRIRPGKRMLSSQTPTIVARDGRPVLVTGSPGGRTIINTTMQVVLNVLEFGMPVAEAVEVERVHHQWFPDKLSVSTFDKRISKETMEALRKMGHVVEARSSASKQGDAHTIWIEPKTMKRVGAADWRRGGAAMGIDIAPAGFRNNGVTAHRGNSGEYPECTMAAFRSGIESGADWIELDVLRTRDGKLVVIHDLSTGRVGDRNLEVMKSAYAELLKVDVATDFRKRRGKTLEECPPARIPLLADVLELVMTQRRTRVSIQPKMDCVADAVALVRRMGAEQWAGFNDGNLDYMSEVKRLAPEIPVFWDRGMSDLAEDLEIARRRGFEALVLNEKALTPEKVRQIQAAGFEAGVWTVNSETDLRRFLKMNVDRIYTDYPRRLLRIKREMSTE